MDFNTLSDAVGGLMTDPNKAALMGLAQGLLASSGPSRLPISMGQAMGNGLQGMQQGRQAALQQKAMQTQNQLNDYQLQMMKIRMGLLGNLPGAGGQPPVAGGQPGQPSQPAIPPTTGGLLGSGTFDIPTGGQAAAGPQPTQTVGGPAAPNPGTPTPGAPGSPNIFGQTPEQLWEMGRQYTIAGIPSGPEMMKLAAQYNPRLAAQMPTDITRMGVQGGMSPEEIQAANRAGVGKANYIPPTPLRTPMYVTADGVTHVVPQDQISAAYGGQAEAQARGKGNIETTKVWDPTANAGRGAFVYQTQSQIADAATGGAPASPGAPATPQGMPAPMRNNNPGALMPNGRLAQFPTPEAGLQALDSNLASYGKSGVTTLRGVITKWAPPNENNTNAYIQDVSQRLSLNPDQPIDLSNPMVRHAISSQIMLHENGPANVFATAAPKRGPMMADPPLGQAQAQGAAQTAPSDQMKKDYETMASAGPQSQQSLEYLDHMLQLAKKKPFYMGAGIGGIPYVDRLSTDAAEYEKARASYIAAQGKSLGSSGTDAARATIDQAVPEYGKPQDAMIRGLTDQRNQLVVGMLRRQFLAPVYQSGDEKGYTSLANGFDQNIKPSMASVLSLPPEAQRSAVQAAIKADPSLRSSYEWAFNHGLLK